MGDAEARPRGAPMRRLAAGASLAIAACLGAPSPAAAAGPAVVGASREVLFSGMCDASAAVPLSEGRFAVADDEGNALRIYDAQRGGPPLSIVDLPEGLGLPRRAAKASKKKGRARPEPSPELDLEAATRIGDHAFWLTSHGRSAAGKSRPERRRLFATQLPREGTPPALIGRAYESLLADLEADPRFAAFGLAQASERAPKDPGGLNIEGMTARREGGVWIGFRNPIPDGRALLFALLDPERLVAGERPRFGDPVRLDLGGLGVRALSWWRGRYLVVAGSYDGGARSRLYTWDGKAALHPVPTLEFRRFNPEAFFSPDELDEVLLLSDDGARPLHGRECKRLEDPGQKRFRGVWVRLPPS